MNDSYHVTRAIHVNNIFKQDFHWKQSNKTHMPIITQHAQEMVLVFLLLMVHIPLVYTFNYKWESII